MKALKSLSRQRSFEPLDALAQQPAEDLQNRHSEIQASLARLSAKHQSVIVLSYEFGYSYREIGQILDCPENTVKTRMFHARKALRALLEA